MAKIETDIKGLNINGIGRMQDQIDAFKKTVLSVSDVGATATEIAKGLKGSQAQAGVKSMGDSIMTEVAELLNDLDIFKEKLNGVAEAYAKYDERAGGEFNNRKININNVKS